MKSIHPPKQRKSILASEILEKIKQGERVEYNYVVVKGDLKLSELDLPTRKVGRMGLELKVINSDIIINYSEIRGVVDFSDVYFQKEISFFLSEFSREANFYDTKFGGGAIFSGAMFHGETRFWDAEFNDRKALFLGAEFGENVEFNGAKFVGGASFRGARFDGDAYFSDVEFSDGEVMFFGAKFDKGAVFQRAKFSGGETYFVGAKFSGGETYFGEAEFGENVEFNGAKFVGGASFHRARFDGDAYFSDVEFSDGEVMFFGAKFGGRADFHKVKFTGGDANFLKAGFNKNLCFDNLKLDRMYINWNSIKDKLSYNGPAYIILIKNFKAIEKFDDADDCYYRYRKESQTRKKLYSKYNGWDCSKFLDVIACVSCGYGVRPAHTVICMFGTVFISGIIFSGYFDTLFESFYFSLMTFTGGELDILKPERWLRIVVMIEAILGYLFMALFIVVLARKFMR